MQKNQRAIDAGIFGGENDLVIAKRLGLKEKEVRQRRQALFQELHATTLKEALAAADRRGMIAWQIPDIVTSE